MLMAKLNTQVVLRHNNKPSPHMLTNLHLLISLHFCSCQLIATTKQHQQRHAHHETFVTGHRRKLVCCLSTTAATTAAATTTTRRRQQTTTNDEHINRLRTDKWRWRLMMMMKLALSFSLCDVTSALLNNHVFVYLHWLSGDVIKS